MSGKRRLHHSLPPSPVYLHVSHCPPARLRTYPPTSSFRLLARSLTRAPPRNAAHPAQPQRHATGKLGSRPFERHSDGQLRCAALHLVDGFIVSAIAAAAAAVLDLLRSFAGSLAAGERGTKYGRE
ncbi:hypothetical protein BKA81DRAFT_376096 [Phyllosticta paracitricarpa]|uniref:Uncharacterized protein n=1 Tax=Phyllosticta citricarpa TaxID=55181 RepID=A0ABR1MGP1_9PEZI